MKPDFRSIFEEKKIKFAFSSWAKLAQRVLNHFFNQFSLARLKYFTPYSDTKTAKQNERFFQKKQGDSKLQHKYISTPSESQSSANPCLLNSIVTESTGEKLLDSIAWGVINTIYREFTVHCVYSYSSTDLGEGYNTWANDLFPASLAPKFFFVISNESLGRLIFEFELEGSRGVYELPVPKGDVVDVWYARDLPPAVILKLNSNRYYLCSFIPLLFDELKETGGLYYGDFYMSRAGTMSDPSSGRDFVLAFCPAVVEFEAASKPIIREGKINSPGLLSLAKYRIEIGDTVRIFKFYYSPGWGKPRLICKSK